MKSLLLSIMIFLFTIPAFADFQQNVQGGSAYTYKFSSSTTVNVIKTGTGILHTLTVEGGSASPINVYDYGSANASALIASYASTNAVQTYTLDVTFSSGCTVTTNGALQYTVSYL